MFKTIVYLIITSFCMINGLENVQIFLKDYISSKLFSPKIEAFLCWEREYAFQLTKLLWHENVFIRIMDTCDDISQAKDEEILSILDLSCPFAKDCLDKAETMKAFKPPHKWMLLDKNLAIFKDDRIFPETNSSQMKTFYERDLNLFTNTTILLDSDVLYAHRENDIAINMEKLYRRKSYLEIIWEKYGYWMLGKGIFREHMNKIISRRRQNLQKTRISAYVVIFDNDTINHLEDFRHKEVDTFIKINYLITTHLMDFMNATPVYVFGKTWGYKGPDGTFTGMMGAIQKGEVDMSGSVLLPSLERMQFVDYLTITTLTDGGFIFRQPPLSAVHNIFTLSFSNTVWIGIGLLIGISVLILHIILSWEKIKYSFDDKESEGITTVDGFFDTVLMAMGAVSQQGSIIEAKSVSGRIATLLIFMSFMFLYTSYSANIVSLIQSDSHSIKTLSDMLNSRMKLACTDTPYFRFFLPLEKGEIKQRIWKEKMHTKGKPNFMPLNEGIDRMRKEQFAFHAEYGVGYKVVEDTFNEEEKCGITNIKYLSITRPFYICPKMSQLKEILKVGLVKIHESGLQKRINDKLYTKKPICSGKGGTFVSVGLDEMTSPLIWLGIGQAIAFVLLIFEKLAHTKFTCFNVNNRNNSEDNY